MSVPYTPPDYVPPEDERSTWAGLERRSRDPVNQLARSFNRLCLEASDRYEIVANLEAMGYNTPSALAKLGVENHFALADALYARTPRAFGDHRPAHTERRDWWGPVAMVLALVATFGLGAYASPLALVAAGWVLVWSQVSAAMLSRAQGELGPDSQRQVLTVLMRAGLVGLGATWVFARFGLEAAAPALLWYAVAGLLWSGRVRLAVAMPSLALAGLAATYLLGWNVALAQWIALLAALGLAVPLVVAPAAEVRGWAVRSLRHVAFHIAYGVGQALLIAALMRDTPAGADVLPGAVLLAMILLASQALLLKLKEEIRERLWLDREPAAFVAAARWAFTSYALIYLAPVVAGLGIVALAGAQAWTYYWFALALFGLALALAVVSFTLGDAATPGLAFLAAGIAAWSGAFLVVAILLVVSLYVLLLRRSAQFERYAGHVV
jgi:hypothetical protein